MADMVGVHRLASTKMKIKELREKSEKELQTMLEENREKLRQIKFEFASKQPKNPKIISQLKKDIARILTLLNYRT
ncbi:MAG: 50S ribosomal protein L29 [Candidatus Portnoybacteria bacterium]|nr:50S ribosomal protein L29 [Candidatus Portnoybacteria bacterium]